MLYFHIFYSIISYLAYALLFLPAVLFVLCGKKFWLERLGLRLPSHSVDLWFHASSLGEVQLLCPLITYLYKKKPTFKIHLSVFTLTGYNGAQAIYGKGTGKQKKQKNTNFSLSYLPFDIPLAMSRFVRKLHPQLVILTEGEHWYHLLRETKKQKIPISLVNGRISKRSYSYYRLFPRLSTHLFSHYDSLFLKSEQDKERYLNLGVDPKKIALTGDLKLDAPLKVQPASHTQKIRHKLGIKTKDFLWLCVSTRPPKEEKILIDVFLLLCEIEPNLKLVIAPRHLKRIPHVKSILKSVGLEFSLYSEGGKKTKCLLIDQMGVLQDFFLAANLAFVGGTMTNTGGHNILEPVWTGTPVVFGPDTSNISDLAKYITEKNYGAQIQDAQELYSLIKKVIRGKKKFKIKQSLITKNSSTQKIGQFLLKRYSIHQKQSEI